MKFLLFILFTLNPIIEKLPVLTPFEIQGKTIINQYEVDKFIEENKNLETEILEEELMMEFYFPIWGDGSCWGDCWYNCVNNASVKSKTNLKSIGTNNYSANLAHDFDLRTAWVEGANGYGIGDYLEYEISTIEEPTVKLTEIIVVNGYVKSLEAWNNNSRVKSMKMYVSDKPVAIINLEDTHAYQRINIEKYIPDNVYVMTIRFEITDIYKGDKFSDTAITELIFNGKGCL